MKDIIYIIIVTYNSLKWIDKCLTSIKNSTVKAEIVIIDNNSKDNTVNHIKNNYPEVNLIENKENKGFGQANNQGIEYAYKKGATHFFLLNQDAYLYKDTIEKLVSIQKKYDLALVSPIHLDGKGEKLDYNFFLKIIINETNNKYVSDLILNNQSDFYQVYKINAAAWMLSRRCIEKIGGFDPIYFHYGEDGNYCQRLFYHNEKCVFVSNSFIKHDRILQGNMEVYNKNHTVMQLLYNYTDINNNLYNINKKKIILHLSHLKRIIQNLILFKFEDSWNILNGYIEFFRKINKINKSMKTNKKLGSSWLNLN